MPLLVAALGWLFRGEKVAPLGIVGLIAGMLGVALIMGTRIGGGADPVSVGLCFTGALALAVATLSMREASSGGNLLMIVGLQMLVGAGSLGVVAALFEPHHLRLSLPFVAAFAYQVLIPGLLGTMLWFVLVRRVGAVRASAYHFLNPFFGVAIAAALLGEKVRLLDGVGVAVAMGGILAVQLSRQRSKD